MKNFFKTVLAIFVALLILGIIRCIIFFSLMGSFASMMQKSTPEIEKNSILEINLSGEVVDRVNEEDYTSLLSQFDDNFGVLSMCELKNGLKDAENQPNIKAVYLNCGALASSPASVQEIRNALIQFKQNTNLPIYAYGESYSQSAYWIATVADSIFLNPYGTVDLKGYCMRTTYYKEAMDKLGVEMEVFKVGTFKSAVEPYILNEMSDANREQLTCLVTTLWNEISSDIAAARGITTEQIDDFINNGGFIQEGDAAMEAKLVDGLFYTAQIDAFLDSIAGGNHKKVAITDIPEAKKKTSFNKIAVYYALGEIDGSTGEGIVSEDVVADLNKLANNKSVKAVVLRINSPGGSAYGSEQMWFAAKQLALKKPLIISMGDYAASGGYYLSSAGDYIIAQPTTLTGSIGIFGIRPNVAQLTDKVGLNYDAVKSHDLSDFGDMTHHSYSKEAEIYQQSVNKGYELFVSRCAAGRDLTTDSIKSIAEGRVWSGKDALRIGLVDELGGLERAIEVAAQRADLEEYTVANYPKEKDLMTKLMEGLGTVKVSIKTVQNLDAESLLKEKLNSMSGIYAIMPYSIDIQ